MFTSCLPDIHMIGVPRPSRIKKLGRPENEAIGNMNFGCKTS